MKSVWEEKQMNITEHSLSSFKAYEMHKNTKRKKKHNTTKHIYAFKFKTSLYKINTYCVYRKCCH